MGLLRRSEGDNPVSLSFHSKHNNNNNSNTLLAALLMYFQAKTGIFASCVIYCGSHLHIKALISPSERVCVRARGWGYSVITWMCSQGKGGSAFQGLDGGRRGPESLPARLAPCGRGWFWYTWSCSLIYNASLVSLSFLIMFTRPNQEVQPELSQDFLVRRKQKRWWKHNFLSDVSWVDVTETLHSTSNIFSRLLYKWHVLGWWHQKKKMK